jgi:hypothetical protein
MDFSQHSAQYDALKKVASSGNVEDTAQMVDDFVGYCENGVVYTSAEHYKFMATPLNQFAASLQQTSLENRQYVNALTYLFKEKAAIRDQKKKFDPQNPKPIEQSILEMFESLALNNKVGQSIWNQIQTLATMATPQAWIAEQNKGQEALEKHQKKANELLDRITVRLIKVLITQREQYLDRIVALSYLLEDWLRDNSGMRDIYRYDLERLFVEMRRVKK